jgi:hypothetical protein
MRVDPIKISCQVIPIKKRQESQKVVFKKSFCSVLALNILTYDQRHFLYKIMLQSTIVSYPSQLLQSTRLVTISFETLWLR